MRISPIAYVCFLLPCGVVTVCYLITAYTYEAFTPCFPFIEGCSSISRVARQDPAIHMFRVVMLPMAPVFGGFWILARAWLVQLGGGGWRTDGMMVLGLIGAFFLVMYVVFLGTDGRVYGLLRRFGTTVYFGGTGVAQLLLGAGLMDLFKAGRLPPLFPPGVLRTYLGICAVMLIFGIAYIPAAEYFRAVNVENIVEWNFAFLMHINFALIFVLWRRQELRLTLEDGLTSHE